MEGKPRLFAPGPVYVPERIRSAMAEPVFHHRSAEFKGILGDVLARLRRVWQADDWQPLVLTCSGSGAMEGAVVNFMRRGAKAINVSAGKFGERWGDILRAYGCDVVELKLDWGRSTSPEEVLEVLDRNRDTRAIFLTSADTSTGGTHPIETIGPAIRKHHDVLIVVDCICDFGGARDVRPKAWEADVAVSCSQKCLMLPPGLGLATIAPRAWRYYESADLPKFYFDWKREADRQAGETITAWTSPVTLIRGLQESLRMIEEEGLPNVIARYARIARSVRAGVQALNLSLLPEAPSDAVTAVKCPPGLAGNKVVDHAQAAYGYRFVNGQDRLKGLIFRIGHMGVLTEADMMGVLHVVERTMADLGQWRGRRGAALAAAEEALDTSTMSPGARRQAT